MSLERLEFGIWHKRNICLNMNINLSLEPSKILLGLKTAKELLFVVKAGKSMHFYISIKIQGKDKLIQIFVYYAIYLFQLYNRYAAAFLWDSGSSVGDLKGAGKTINSIDIKQNRPYRLITASEDFSTYFYEGPPFKQKDFKTVSLFFLKINVCYRDKIYWENQCWYNFELHGFIFCKYFRNTQTL